MNDLVDKLLAERVAVIDSFLPAAIVDLLREEASALRASGAFRRAGVGKGDAKQLVDEIRRDEILWLPPVPATPAQSEVWGRLESVRETLNRELYLGARELEAHFAYYPPGAFYRKHRDRFHPKAQHSAPQGGARVLSCILYLNEAWQEGDGGGLQLYGQTEESAPWREVLPLPGRFVCFFSDELYHEVLPTRRARWSLTGWFRQ